MNVLILDDEVLSVEFMLAQVNWEKCGISRVLTAYSAEEAREIVENNPVDIILCDIEMPGDNGIAFMQWVRSEGYTMICIFLTCHAKFEYAQEALRLESKDYILKPAPFDVIEAKVMEAVNELHRRQADAKVLDIGRQWIQNQKDYIDKHYGEVKSRESLAAQMELYIYEHMGDFDLSVSKIAEYMHMNVDYMSNLFKQVKGITLNKFIVQKRMEVAGLLLREGNMSINSVARQVGYENYSYFSSSFKKAYGCSPAGYIKKN